LGEILRERGFISPEQLDRLLALQKKHCEASAAAKRETGGECVFGQRLLQKKLVTPEQLNECLRDQERENAQGRPKNLGQILVEKGYVAREKVKEILAEQQRVIVACNGCGARFNATAGAKLPKCPACGGELAVPPWSISLPVLDTIQKNGETAGLIGKEMGGVKIQAFVSRSAKGVLYKAARSGQDGVVAVKVIAVTPVLKGTVTRFLQAAKALAGASHPGLLRVHHAAVAGTLPYIVTDFIHGRPLRIFPDRETRVPPRDLLAYAQSIARGLAFAHARKIVHGDLTPDNILVSATREIYIKDFGFARPVELKETGKPDRIFHGTPAFMAPELWDGKPADARTDLYALGVTLYLLMAGHKPFDGLHLQALIDQHRQAAPPPIGLGGPGSSGLEAVIMKLLAKDPAQRYQTAEALGADLARIRTGGAPQAATETQSLAPSPCQVCGAMVPVSSEKCPQCGSASFEGDMKPLVRQVSRTLAGEFECANCGTILKQGVTRCSRCNVEICKNCKRQVAVIKGLCGECISSFSSNTGMPTVSDAVKPPSRPRVAQPPSRSRLPRPPVADERSRRRLPPRRPRR
jgi:serine/threonine protein kinase/ribosomal protein L37AE/L43A